MNNPHNRWFAEGRGKQSIRISSVKTWKAVGIAILLVGAAWFGYSEWGNNSGQPAPAPPQVVVSAPLQRELSGQLGFLGQFSALDQVELRAQVGGTLTEIHFKDGDIVRKGDLLLVIDPIPYEIKLAQATAQLETATARFDLANRELTRAQALKRSDAGSVENVDQRQSEQRAAQAAVDDAKAQIRDAQFDLDHCSIKAPFTGRIGTHQVSVGNLVAGSRAATSPTTLLATLVSLDPIYLNFDMSESDFMAFLRERLKQKVPLTDKVEIALSDEADFSRQGTLDFVDNMLDRSSGTIHARATVSNADLLLTPGAFARVRLAVGAAVATLLVPDAAVMQDQSEHIVMTVGADDTVVPKQVQIGDIRGGLRIIKSGLQPTDKIVIQGLPYAAPGKRVTPQDGTIQFASIQGKN